jgi:hypothetical protein
MEAKYIYIKPDCSVITTEDLCDIATPIRGSQRAHHGNAKSSEYNDFEDFEEYDDMDKFIWED